MAAFRSLTANREPLENFEALSPKVIYAKSKSPSAALPLHLFEWSQSNQDGKEISNLKSVPELEARDPATVRVMYVQLQEIEADTDCCRFAPQDKPSSECTSGLIQLFEKFDIPSAFIAESLQGISQSFAAQKDIDGTTYVWFHFLCKTVSVIGERIVHQQNPQAGNSYDSEAPSDARNQSHADFTWLKPGFVLKVRKQQGPPLLRSRTRTSSSDATMAGTSADSKVELFCFGAPASLGDRFRKLKQVAICDDLMQDPYVLLEVVMEEMYKVLDQTAWTVSRVFGNMETVRFIC
jgi:hypothetical protein